MSLAQAAHIMTSASTDQATCATHQSPPLPQSLSSGRQTAGLSAAQASHQGAQAVCREASFLVPCARLSVIQIKLASLHLLNHNKDTANNFESTP